MTGKFTKTEKLLFIMTAAFLIILGIWYLQSRPAAGTDYTVTAQYELEAAEDLD